MPERLTKEQRDTVIDAVIQRTDDAASCGSWTPWRDQLILDLLDANAALLARAEQAEADSDEAREYARTLLASRVVTCVYCGHEYPQGTPASGSDLLTAHIKVCEKHPMRQAEADRKVLAEELIRVLSEHETSAPKNLAVVAHALTRAGGGA